MKKYEVVIEHIIRGAQTGNLRLGDYLPSIRSLSKDLGISPPIVFDAYYRLERMGLITSEERRGFRLTNTSSIPVLPADTQSGPLLPLDIQTQHYINRIPHKMVLIGSVAPPNKYLPSEELSKCLYKAARENPGAINSYGYSTDFVNTIYPVEQTTAKYMYRILGITTAESEICHANGATDALFFALCAIAKRGDFVAVESPGFLGAYNIIRRLHLIPVEIETVPPRGLNIDSFELMLNMGIRPSCLIATPNFQNPTGSLMPLENRKRLLELCKKNGTVIIEDDTLGALRFGCRIPTLKELAPEDVIYVNSYSKVMAPGYRVGWVAGGRHARDIRMMQGLESFVMTLSSHLAVARYLDGGNFRSYIINLRRIYEKNRDLMARAIRDCFPEGSRVFTPEGGSYIWVSLPEHMSASDIFAEAMKRDILLAPGVMFNGTNKYGNCLRFCFAMEISQEVLDAIETVGNLLSNGNAD